MDKHNAHELWERVKAENKKNGITMRGLFESCHINRRSGENWVLKGTIPPVDAFLKICLLLKADPYTLYYGDDAPSSEELNVVLEVRKKLDAREINDIDKKMRELEKSMEALRKKIDDGKSEQAKLLDSINNQ